MKKETQTAAAIVVTMMTVTTAMRNKLMGIIIMK